MATAATAVNNNNSSSSGRVQLVRAALLKRGISAVSDDWLRACIDFVQSSCTTTNNNTNNSSNSSCFIDDQQLQLHVYAQWLECDLTQLGVSGSLPVSITTAAAAAAAADAVPDDNCTDALSSECRGGSSSSSSSCCSTLAGVHAVQVQSVVDVSQPAYQQYRQLVAAGDDNCDVGDDGDNHRTAAAAAGYGGATAAAAATGGGGGGGGGRVWRLEMTDGCRHLIGLQCDTAAVPQNGRGRAQSTAHAVDWSRQRPGCKVLLRGPLEVRRGVALLLGPGCVLLLGGGVDGLAESASCETLLARRLSQLTAGRFCPQQQQQEQQQEQHQRQQQQQQQQEQHQWPDESVRQLPSQPAATPAAPATATAHVEDYDYDYDDDLDLINCADQLEQLSRATSSTTTTSPAASLSTTSPAATSTATNHNTNSCRRQLPAATAPAALRNSCSRSPLKNNRPVKHSRIDSLAVTDTATASATTTPTTAAAAAAATTTTGLNARVMLPWQSNVSSSSSGGDGGGSGGCNRVCVTDPASASVTLHNSSTPTDCAGLHSSSGSWLNRSLSNTPSTATAATAATAAAAATDDDDDDDDDDFSTTCANNTLHSLPTDALACPRANHTPASATTTATATASATNVTDDVLCRISGVARAGMFGGNRQQHLSRGITQPSFGYLRQLLQSHTDSNSSGGSSSGSANTETTVTDTATAAAAGVTRSRVTVRAFIMTQTSRLSADTVAHQTPTAVTAGASSSSSCSGGGSGGGGKACWRLSVRISDGTANIEAQLSDAVLTQLIQLPAADVQLLKAAAAGGNADARARLRQVLEAAQRRVIDLCALMTVERVSGAVGGERAGGAGAASFVVVDLADIKADTVDMFSSALLD